MSKVYTEVSGIIKGVVQVDFITTAQETKKPYLDVLYPDHYTADSDYPLTYVPNNFWITGLKEGDVVYAIMNQKDLRYPVLYKTASELPAGMIDDWVLPVSAVSDFIQIPEKKPTLTVLQLGEGSYILTTEDYVAIRTGDTGFVLSSSGITALGSLFQSNAPSNKLKKLQINQGVDNGVKHAALTTALTTATATINSNFVALYTLLGVPAPPVVMDISLAKVNDLIV